MLEHLLPSLHLEQFCQRWQIEEFAVFGSILRPDFDEDSDLDVMVTFLPGAKWSLLDHVQMKLELEELIGRRVDLVTRPAIEHSHNTVRREAILSTAITIFQHDESIESA